MKKIVICLGAGIIIIIGAFIWFYLEDKKEIDRLQRIITGEILPNTGKMTDETIRDSQNGLEKEIMDHEGE